MDFLPWKTFHRIVARYGGNHCVRTLSCAEQFRVMAFAQLTYRESLRDIEVCLSAQATKLYHMEIREPVARATLADANEMRDWRIYADFAQTLIVRAGKLYATESLGVDLSNTVYALDPTTIDLRLSMFPWAPFRSTKAAVKMHTLPDHCTQRLLRLSRLSRSFAPYPFQGSRIRQDIGVPDEPNDVACTDDLRSVQSPLAGRTLFQMDQAAPADQALPWHLRERREEPDMDRRLGPCAGSYLQKGIATRCLALHFATDFCRSPFCRRCPSSKPFKAAATIVKPLLCATN
jgi:hypothetical protein